MFQCFEVSFHSVCFCHVPHANGQISFFFVRDLKKVQELNHTVDDWNPGITTPNLVIWEKATNLNWFRHQPYFHFPSDIAVPSCPILSQRFAFPTGTGHTYRELGFWLGILHGGYSCRSQLMRKTTKTTWWFGRKAAARKKPWAHFGWRWVWKVLLVSRFLCNTFSLRLWVMREIGLPNCFSKLQLCFRRLLSSCKASSLVWWLWRIFCCSRQGQWMCVQGCWLPLFKTQRAKTVFKLSNYHRVSFLIRIVVQEVWQTSISAMQRFLFLNSWTFSFPPNFFTQAMLRQEICTWDAISSIAHEKWKKTLVVSVIYRMKH